eukprot:gene380-biopygen7888
MKVLEKVAAYMLASSPQRLEDQLPPLETVIFSASTHTGTAAPGSGGNRCRPVRASAEVPERNMGKTKPHKAFNMAVTCGDSS